MSVASALCPQRLSDEQLLQHYSAGHRQVLEELFDRYRFPAYRVAHRLLGNEADALDAVQEGFVKALSHLDGFQGRSSFKTWLFRVASNAALDLGRARSRRELLSLDAPRDEHNELAHPVIADDPAAGLQRADLRRLLQEALAQLPDAQQRTFVLHADGGLSYREVADVLEISIGTVMSRLFYARQKLRAWLSARLPDGELEN
jgi:RNA polymerase sigma-70 factor (ECF subfamily)